MMANILVVDDDPELREMLDHQLKHMGHETGMAAYLQEGLAKASEGPWDVVLLDVWLPDGNGLEYIPGFIGSWSMPEVIIITGDSEPNGAEAAIRSGAWSYIDKSRLFTDLKLFLPRILQYREEKQRVTATPVALRRRGIVGNSEKLGRCLDDLARASVSMVNVLISGETGTGKEIFARAIHENSKRGDNDFVVVDCASLSENLVESTLFGHTKGAFTGADRAHSGLLSQANGGTLFLDEIGELPSHMQKSFLRVLQEHRFRPLGSTVEECSDFRLVAATNRNLEEMVEQGLFRRDLFHRLKGVHIHLPSLRERKEDIHDLVTHFLKKVCRRYDMEIKGFSPDFIEALASYDWPGNVRELSQLIEHIVAVNVEVPTLYSIHLPETFRIRVAKSEILKDDHVSGTSPEARGNEKILPWREFKSAIEKDYVGKLMARCSGNIQEACRLSGLSRTRLYQILNKYGMTAS